VIYQEQHAAHRDPAVLDLAVGCFDTAAELTSEDDPNLPMYLSNLGTPLVDRYLARQADEDLRQAIVASQRAVSLTPRRSPDWPTYVDNLGGALMQRYEAGGAMADVDAPVTAFRAAARGQRGADERAMTLANLADALRVRASRTARRADIRSALAAARKAIRFTSPASPHLAARLAGVADVLRERYLRNGRLGMLDEAINTYRRIRILAADIREVPGHQYNLANCLRDRYAAVGSRSDLEEAIALSRQAVAKAGLVRLSHRPSAAQVGPP
jgi:tetratricopeptide (TPR) repeat protein